MVVLETMDEALVNAGAWGRRPRLISGSIGDDVNVGG